MDGVPRPSEHVAPSTILVVDDDDATRRLITRWVERTGLSVSEAPDGDVALEMIEADPASFAVVILDVMMPTRDGYDVLSSLRAAEQTRGIPVILLTAHANDEPHVVKSLELGAADHVAKPFSGPVL